MWLIGYGARLPAGVPVLEPDRGGLVLMEVERLDARVLCDATAH